MRLRASCIIPWVFPWALCCASSLLRAQGTCFTGPIRPSCKGFLLLEATGVASGGLDEHTESFSLTTGSGVAVMRSARYRDLPSYVSGSIGYVGVIDSRTAIG